MLHEEVERICEFLTAEDRAERMIRNYEGEVNAIAVLNELAWNLAQFDVSEVGSDERSVLLVTKHLKQLP